MRVLTLISFFLILQASSCNQEEPVILNNEGVITSKPTLWKTPISENNKYAAGVRNNIKYNQTVVVGSIENGKNGIMGIDVTNGEKLWTWQDNFSNYTLDIMENYAYDNNLIWQEGRHLYWVDLATGKTVWKKRYDEDELPSFRGVDGVDEVVYVNADYSPYLPNDPNIVKIYNITSSGSSLTEIARMSSDSIGLSHGTAVMAIFKTDTGETLMFTDSFSFDPDMIGTISQGYFNLYNISKKKWVYYKKEWSFFGGIAKPKLHNGIVYNAVKPYIAAVDLMSGEVVWQRKFGERVNFFNSGFILVPEKNLIVFNAETTSTTLYALDLTTGNEVWSEPSSGTSSHLQYLNGVVYFVGGGDGLLHAVDIDTGKHLWKIRSPDEAINSNAWFARYCAVFEGTNGEKGKVVVSSGLHAFAYEAER